MKKLLLLYILTIVPLIMPLNTQAMSVTNSPISNINVYDHSSFITINDTPWTDFINSDFFVYLLNNKIKILIGAAAGIFLIKKIFFPTIESPTNTKKDTIYDDGEMATKEIIFTGIDGINGWGSGNLTITCDPDGEEKLTITADKNILAILEGQQSHTTLKFGPQVNVYFKTHSPITYVALVKTLNKIFLEGSLKTTTNTINSDNLIIAIDGSATLDSEIETNNVDIHCNGSSSARLQGKTLHQKINLDGSSKLDASTLMGNTANIKMDGSSKTWFFLQKANDNRLQLTMDGSTQLNGTIDIESLQLTMDGSSKATLQGKALNQEIKKLDGSSKLDASKLMGNTATIRMDGSAKAWLSVQQTISYHIYGSSKIIYYGEPAIKGKKYDSAKIHQASFYE